MKYIRHPKIINLYAMSSHVQPFCIVTELVLGNLLEYLQGKILHICINLFKIYFSLGRRGRMVVGFLTTYAISAYHH
jgi:hypothetical protein